MQWNLKTDSTISISQQSAPISVVVPLSDRILLTAVNFGAITKSDSTKVQGVADTRLWLSYVLPGDKFWLTAGTSIPTGKTKLETGELTMMTIMSQNAFAYKVPLFGQGLNANAGLAYATPLTRRLVMGVGAAYIFRGEYEPLAVGGTKYNPGDEISMNVGLDYTTYSKTSRISFDGSMAYFGEDKLNGASRFQLGRRFLAVGVYSLSTEKLNHKFSVRLRYRLQNTSITDSLSTKYDAGTQLEGQYTLTYPLNEWLTGIAAGQVKSYSTDQLPIGGAAAGTGKDYIETGKTQIISLGADFLFLFSDVVTPTLTIRYSTGDITIEDTNYDVTGFEIGFALKVSL